MDSGCVYLVGAGPGPPLAANDRVRGSSGRGSDRGGERRRQGLCQPNPRAHCTGAGLGGVSSQRHGAERHVAGEVAPRHTARMGRTARLLGSKGGILGCGILGRVGCIGAEREPGRNQLDDGTRYLLALAPQVLNHEKERVVQDSSLFGPISTEVVRVELEEGKSS